MDGMETTLTEPVTNVLEKPKAKYYDKKRALLQHRRYYRRLRLEVLAHYSLAEEPECIRCGTNDIDVLQIDHIDNNGSQHRKIAGHGVHLYLWFKRNGYPEGFQIMCANCNLKKKAEYMRERRNDN